MTGKKKEKRTSAYTTCLKRDGYIYILQ